MKQAAKVHLNFIVKSAFSCWKIKKHIWELLKQEVCLSMRDLWQNVEDSRGPFKKHVETLHGAGSILINAI